MNWEPIRFIINGGVATAVHFLVLWVCLKIFLLDSAGFSNLIASVFGIIMSFLGNRYFVFRRFEQSIIQQFSKFSGIYCLIALLNGLLLFIITDYYGIDFRIGFIISVIVQVILGYLGSKFLVFFK